MVIKSTVLQLIERRNLSKFRQAFPKAIKDNIMRAETRQDCFPNSKRGFGVTKEYPHIAFHIRLQVNLN